MKTKKIKNQIGSVFGILLLTLAISLTGGYVSNADDNLTKDKIDKNKISSYMKKAFSDPDFVPQPGKTVSTQVNKDVRAEFKLNAVDSDKVGEKRALTCGSNNRKVYTGEHNIRIDGTFTLYDGNRALARLVFATRADYNGCETWIEHNDQHIEGVVSGVYLDNMSNNFKRGSDSDATWTKGKWVLRTDHQISVSVGFSHFLSIGISTPIFTTTWLDTEVSVSINTGGTFRIITKINGQDVQGVRCPSDMPCYKL
ncbi:MAG: hypothetical protein LBM13_03305 [Candidatus Ancillula sp.]|jgi:hypothetical protein|nr:hypothetical protein [Candidatus Ancillula sp.]